MAESAGGEKAIGVRVLAFCGESLLIEGIEASLKDHQGVETALLDTSRPGVVQALDKLSPDIIVFDLAANQLSRVFAFLRTHTDVVLIGLDVDRDLALFLSWEWCKLPTLADLMRMIEEQIQVKKGR